MVVFRLLRDRSRQSASASRQGCKKGARRLKAAGRYPWHAMVDRGPTLKGSQRGRSLAARSRQRLLFFVLPATSPLAPFQGAWRSLIAYRRYRPAASTAGYPLGILPDYMKRPLIANHRRPTEPSRRVTEQVATRPPNLLPLNHRPIWPQTAPVAQGIEQRFPKRILRFSHCLGKRRFVRQITVFSAFSTVRRKRV